jgi:hypothetical protein
VKLQRIKLRSYRSSFEPKQALAISQLITDLNEIRKQRNGYKLYVYELQGCLSYGLLFAAVSVSTAMLELFIRDLYIAQLIRSCHGGNTRMKARVEREVEGDKQMNFSQMLKQLEPTVIEPNDKEKLTTFYQQTRIPLAHALVRRLTSTPDADPLLSDLFADMARSSDFEERFEKGSIRDLRFVVRIVKKYHPWLNLRRDDDA